MTEAATCDRCGGAYWVCEDHDSTSWGDGEGCCGAPGMPCPACNPPRFDAEGYELMPLDEEGTPITPNLLFPWIVILP